MKKNYIILPVYNDWESLKKVLEILNRSFKTLKSNNFIIIVNDFSSKKLKLNKKYSNFKKIHVLNLKKMLVVKKLFFLA